MSKAACWLMLLLSANVALCATETTLTSDTQLSSEGYFVLSWSIAAESGEMQLLQESPTPDFSRVSTFDIAPTGALTLTGYPDGEYFFRAGTPGNWSATLEVTVAHHALGRALAFFAVGLLLFVILVVVILRGNRMMGGNQD
jgi:hypothetical protein